MKLGKSLQHITITRINDSVILIFKNDIRGAENVIDYILRPMRSNIANISSIINLSINGRR